MNILSKRLIFAVLAGLLLSTSSVYIGFSIYAWLGLVPLFLLIKSSDSYKGALVEALAFILAYNSSFFLWIFGVHPLTWLGLTNNQSLLAVFWVWSSTVIFHSLLLSPVFLLSKYLYKNQKLITIFRVVFISLAWVLITHTLTLSLGQGLRAVAIPLNEIVYSQYQFKELIQICNMVGAVGLEVIIVAVNVLIVDFIEVPRNFQFLNYKELKINQKQFYKNTAIVALVFVSLFAYGKYTIQANKDYRMANKEKWKSFAIVQANYPVASNKIQSVKPMELARLQEQLSEKIKGRRNLLLWSEGSVPELSKVQLQNTTFRKLSAKADVFVYGTWHPVVDEVYNSIEFIEYRYKGNQSVGFNLKRYFKNRLMPYGEYTPFYKFLPKSFKELSDKTIGQNFIAAKFPKPVKIGNLSIAASLCSELLFPELFKEQVQAGANILVNLNNLSWFRSPLNLFTEKCEGAKDQPAEDWVKKLLFSVGVFRAIENKRELILVANTGYSGLINASGISEIKGEANRIGLIEGFFLPINQDGP